MFYSKSGYFLFMVFLLVSTSIPALSQQGKFEKDALYVDKQGLLRWKKTNKEAAFFGVNYTAPFAYGYRSIKRTGISLEEAIDQDVYHLARLGLDAFRVHVWDWEITDSLGNLLENEHLRLFDYLLAKLKERNIKILITPIAFWGNGYPEKDEHTRSFSDVYGKGPAVVVEGAIKAQERYLQQFFTHLNPYTKLSYKNDPDVIATELNNEPHHSGPKEKTTEYINRLTAAVRSTGWTKPIFYNISESPAYADAVAKAKVQGHSFQWYPTGLVANHTLQGNFLPNVDKYHIPFSDTIPAFESKARMVYEFDAGDVLQSNMYPAMARSFREAGFQWATQFAYDPMATAYANTEYQTHYLNLAYVPSKAISLLIASKAFHTLPRAKAYGTYPADSVFDVFRVSYKAQLSEMNSQEEFYYSNTTTSHPVSRTKLKHIAGVGSSAIVQYSGLGAYFIDKVADGVWRLEVMPDAIHIRDPFERASPSKEVTRIQWQQQQMKILFPDLGADFSITAINTGNNYTQTASANSFTITPGTYLLKSAAKASYSVNSNNNIGTLRMNEFVAPQAHHTNTFVSHSPVKEVSPGVPFKINAKIVSIPPDSKVTAELRHSAGKWKTIQLTPASAYNYTTEVPADMVTPGVINYRIIVQSADTAVVFPGDYHGDPYAWDAYKYESWETYIAASKAPIALFTPASDRNNLDIYNPLWRDNTIGYVTGVTPMQLVQKLTMNKPVAGQDFGWQLFIGDKLKGRKSEVASLQQLVVRAGSASTGPVKVKLALVTLEGVSFSTEVEVAGQPHDITIALSSLKPDSLLLLPRPYPGFQPLLFQPATTNSFSMSGVERLQLYLISDKTNEVASKSLEVESILLR